MVTIRTFTPADYEALVALRNAVQPEPISVEEFREMDEMSSANSSTIWTRFVAEDEAGGVIGYVGAGHYSDMPPHHFSIFVNVRQDSRRHGIGTQLLAEAERWALANDAQEALSSYMRSEDAESFAWAQRRNFALDLDRTESVLDLTRWDGARFAGHVEKVRAEGLELVALTEYPSAEHLRGMYEVEVATAPDVPAYEGHMPSWEEWRAEILGWKAPKVIAMGLHGDRVVAWSMLSLPRVAGAGAYTNYTGVLRAYRGRGLALALKLLTIEGAVANGTPRMRTNNDFENPAMLAVNEKLGYRLVPGPRRIKKKL